MVPRAGCCGGCNTKRFARTGRPAHNLTMNDTQPTTAYAVCRDDYEDHSAVALFTTRGLADGHLAQLDRKRPGGFEVLEYVVLDHAPVPARSYSRSVQVGFSSGVQYPRGAFEHGDWDYERSPEQVTARYTPSGVPEREAVGWALVHVLAHSAERADSLMGRAVEAALRLRAEGAWPVKAGPFDLGIDPAVV